MRKPMKTPETAHDGEWDFAGAQAPPKNGKTDEYETFSLGCFQWTRGQNGRLKRGRVQKRFYGCCNFPRGAYMAAERFCQEMNDKVFSTPPEAE